jgi:hypothetical protein
MKPPKLFASLAVTFCCVHYAVADTFTIADFTFNQANSVTTAAIVGSPRSLKDHSNRYFGRISDLYLRSGTRSENEFASFDHSKSIGRLAGGGSGRGDAARHITFPDGKQSGVMPNRDRIELELTWGGKGLPNGPGFDFVVYESAEFEGFGVAVQKAGSEEFSEFRYRFRDTEDKLHNVNAIPFDLSEFGIAAEGLITAIRIVNLFNSEAAGGADRVDDPSGQGRLLRVGDAGYDEGYPLLDKPGGREFTVDWLNADIIYVVGLHDIRDVPAQ